MPVVIKSRGSRDNTLRCAKVTNAGALAVANVIVDPGICLEVGVYQLIHNK
jgi:hypothetical protein